MSRLLPVSLAPSDSPISRLSVTHVPALQSPFPRLSVTSLLRFLSPMSRLFAVTHVSGPYHLRSSSFRFVVLVPPLQSFFNSHQTNPIPSNQSTPPHLK